MEFSFYSEKGGGEDNSLLYSSSEITLPSVGFSITLLSLLTSIFVAPQVTFLTCNYNIKPGKPTKPLGPKLNGILGQYQATIGCLKVPLELITISSEVAL